MRVHKMQGILHVPNLCFELMAAKVMHPVSTTNVYSALTVVKYLFILASYYIAALNCKREIANTQD